MIIKPEGTYVDYFNSRPLSASAIKLYMKSPELFAWNRFDSDFVRSETAAATEGTDLHCAVLEPSKYAQTYNWFDGNRRTKAGKEEYAAMVESGMEIRKREEIKRTLDLRRRIMANPSARALLEAAPYRERDLTYQHADEPKLRLVAKIDAFGVKTGIETQSFGVDIKSVRSADPGEVSRASAFGRWDIQEAVYRQAIEANGYGRVGRFYFLVVEREAPFRVRVLELGREERIRGLRAVDYSATCIVNRYKAWDWESVGESRVIEYPSWFKQSW